MAQTTSHAFHDIITGGIRTLRGRKSGLRSQQQFWLHRRAGLGCRQRIGLRGCHPDVQRLEYRRGHASNRIRGEWRTPG